MENIALTLREIADQVNREAKERKIALHREFVETKIIPHLQEMANRGRYATDFTVPGYSVVIICDLLRNLGFTTEVVKYKDKDDYIVVKW